MARRSRALPDVQLHDGDVAPVASLASVGLMHAHLTEAAAGRKRQPGDDLWPGYVAASLGPAFETGGPRPVEVYLVKDG